MAKEERRPPKGSPLGQLIVVSNRVSVPERNASARAGGLEVAVNAALKERSGTWFGWSGKIATHGTITTQKVVQNDLTFITIDLSREDHQEYYRGFANRVLWPIFHYRIDLAEFSRRDLSGYLRVNDNFAHHLDKVLGPDDLGGCMTITYFRSLRHSASVGTKIASAFSFIFHARRPRC